MNHMPVNRNKKFKNNCQNQGSILKCFGDIRAIIAEVSTETLFFFEMDLIGILLMLKLPLKNIFFLLTNK